MARPIKINGFGCSACHLPFENSQAMVEHLEKAHGFDDASRLIVENEPAHTSTKLMDGTINNLTTWKIRNIEVYYQLLLGPEVERVGEELFGKLVSNSPYRQSSEGWPI